MKDDGKLTICPGKKEMSQLLRYKVREARALHYRDSEGRRDQIEIYLVVV